jgi:hypothetical protein
VAPSTSHPPKQTLGALCKKQIWLIYYLITLVDNWAIFGAQIFSIKYVQPYYTYDIPVKGRRGMEQIKGNIICLPKFIKYEIELHHNKLKDKCLGWLELAVVFFWQILSYLQQ